MKVLFDIIYLDKLNKSKYQYLSVFINERCFKYQGINVTQNHEFTFYVLVVQIKPTTIVSEGGTAHLKGMIKFHHSIRYVKWQICLNEKFVDIDVHKPKYLGTTNVLQHPELVIHDVDADDQVEYRLEVQMTKSKEYSNVETVKINRSKGKF